MDMDFNLEQLAELADAVANAAPVRVRVPIRSGAGTPMEYRRNYAISLLANGYTHQEAADACGVARTTVSSWASKAGMLRYPRTGGARIDPARTARTLARKERDTTISRLQGEGLTTSQIARELGVSYSTIASRVRRIKHINSVEKTRGLATRREEVAAAYRGGSSIAEIADARGESFYKVYNVLYRLGLVGGRGKPTGGVKS